MDDNATFELQNPKLSHRLHEQFDEQHQDDDVYEDVDGHEEDDKEEEEEEEEESETSVFPVGAEFMEFQSHPLSVPSSIMFSETDQHAELALSSSPQQLLTDMASVNSLSSGGIKEEIGAFHQDVFTVVTVPSAQLQTENQFGQSQCAASSEFSPTCISGQTRVTVIEQKPSPDMKAVAVPIMKTPATDGYSWRKYGQKQVKSTEGSRSYYKCTYSECCSKKIECSDHSGGIMETIYKGTHGHEPPRKSNHTKESRIAASPGNDVGNSLMTHPVKTLNNPNQPCSSRETIQETSPLPECKRQKLSDSDRTVEHFKDEQVVEPELKHRLKKSGAASQGSVLKADKKSKLVVRAAGDVRISSDGYRWRKYGQKMVKGNPHPRNYYRCTSAGCPVRKHVEIAMDNTNAIIIIYKGVHDHDMPVPKKRHGPPSTHLVAAALPVSISNLQFKSCDSIQDQIPSTNWSLGTGGELTGEAQDLGIEKTVEASRTLLSIGFEIKPC